MCTAAGKEVLSRGEVFTPVDSAVHDFIQHVEGQCEICPSRDSSRVVKRGRPKKGYAGPGKYTRLSHSPLQNNAPRETQEDRTNLDSSKSSFTRLSAGHRKEFVKFLVETLDKDELEL